MSNLQLLHGTRLRKMTGMHRAVPKNLGSSSELVGSWVISARLQELGNTAVQLAMTTVTTTLLLSMLFFREAISRVLTRSRHPQLTAFTAA